MTSRTTQRRFLEHTDWRMARALVGLGLICSLVIVTVFNVTAPVIRENRAAALQQAIFSIFPEAQGYTVYRWNESGQLESVASGGDGTETVYGCYDDEKHLLGYAIEAKGMGYQDTIRLLYGYAPQQSAIVGMVVLESRETPGLGARIATDAGFQGNFHHLDVRLELLDGLQGLVEPFDGRAGGHLGRA